MSTYYELIPLDTLFFRGATPMEAGQYNTISMFPPPVSVIKGAFWTAYCNESGKEYSVGLTSDGEIPFDVTGIFIKKLCSDNKYRFYIPAPATWYYDSSDKFYTGSKLEGVNLCIAENNDSLEKLGMISSAGNVVFVAPKEDAKPLTNCWVDIEFIKNPSRTFCKHSVLFAADIYSMENRTGNGLDSNKKADDGKLYTSTHIRLNPDVSIVVSFENLPSIKDSGKILLGGERRLCEYKKIHELSLNEKDSKEFVSLVPVEANEENLKSLISSQKLTVASGWDLQKGFHKPSKTWIPAGAVFNKKINSACMALEKINK